MEQIAGHRIVRVVREEGERRVLAAFGDEAVALHVADGETAMGLAAEAEALLAVAHPHLLPVLDVATVDGAVVLVRPMATETAASWLLGRTAPRVGEAVTIAVPVLDAAGALHAAGAIAGRIDLRSIVLDADGAPALEGVGARLVTDRPTLAWREADAGVAADCLALGALVDELLAACGEAVPRAVANALGARDARAASAALLAAWSATPIEHGAAEPSAVQRPSRERPRSEVRAHVLVRWAQQVLAQLALVRRPVWIAAGAGAAALVVALALGGAGASEADESASRPSASPVLEAGAAVPVGMPAAAETAVDAAAALLAARERCLGEGDAACLAGILDPTGGAASSTWRLPADAAYAEVAVLGDAVLVEVASSSEPASVLVVRTDAGWMLRDAWAA
ncbi:MULTISPECIES: hypothetical protein [unclassified Agrococcus]|uniref:hypothetical protein n=1 Tax=unclassified Agrococcus TaxID=2615065 RepID=UPI003613A1F8